MTTTVTVKALHGWPVKVTSVDSVTGVRQSAPTVAAGQERDFYVHSNADLIIHEIQPDEQDK